MNDEHIEAWWKLYTAIIIRALKDYKKALRKTPRDKWNTDPDIKKIERFFHSSLYEQLTDLDGDYLIKVIKDDLNGVSKKGVILDDED